MAGAEEQKRRTKAWVITLAVHAVAILLFIFFGLKQPVPLPEDAGASIAFGWDTEASGESVADIQEPSPETAAEHTVPEVVEPTETPIEETVTEEQSEVEVPKPKPEEKPKPAKPKPEKPVEKPKPQLSEELSNALESLGRPGGGSQGNSQQGTGNEGKPSGTSGNGLLGGGSGSWQLDGRSMLPGYGTKITDTKEEGVVVLNFWVDRSGKVTRVEPNLALSNTTSQYLINLAKTDVLNNFRFNRDPAAAVGQRGTVRYVFQLK